ncbi:FMN-binding negative transcriptional regulator [Comamonas endophytica]|uniref:FMN-binding negative transcriptional regulator n=1 Tax=Comamonas endophytica TaxID=2949090 RepID=A0ABY6G8G4_9BURK|nr:MULTISPECIES: FMN-binding negative transcriptional regulator [unclassified Acidovorax]MCD2511298.1 FMN-binding negative transcriptional regulator [Acidovorax sp. D4N7]UYG50692.1 FMN-binding negative transcriptional regulator [Acidovorax sp. 5MLIR]
MYIPPYFAEVRPEELSRIIHDHPLGMLVTHGPGGLDADHIPFEFDAEARRLTAHVARANPLWQRCAEGSEVMVVFRGAEGYVSPNWYPSKHEAHRQVPTWNYEVVHAHGVLTVRDDERFVRGLVGRLTRRHEASQPRPWKMSDAAPGYVDELLRAIVGIEIALTSLTGKRKLSQNKEARDRLGAAEGLEAVDNAALARAMRQAG